MDVLAASPRWDWRRTRAWGALEGLLTTHPEGVAGIAALDRLVAYDLREREAMDFLDELRADGRIRMMDGRWTLV
jgi:hypothetical protein